ncbi:PEP-CTERM sorting domain-containing protein [Adhaeretor mobilis]|uniref:Ice-binding protein C-terminal domain-containing protein n=1 Tax=Adhaeretor mobilis TaxID=1930276 RepID=A0A517N2L8_9BACT|nr:PEP-CTERM sorting domain-containing protein [Adhaeretor mobilis]QDT01373.1 hypothetical protein HG15A2_47150 [Adhaeretor mobilis]
MRSWNLLSAGLIACAFALPVSAGEIVFTETFDTNNASWANSAADDFVTHVPTGGVLDSGYVTTQRTFEEIAGGSSVTFRAQDEFNSSGNAFVGNWRELGYTQLKYSVRHNAPVPVSFSARASGPGNFPGATSVTFGAPVLPNVWTDLTFEFSAGSPSIVTYEGSDHETVFSNVGHVQVSMSVPVGFETSTQPITIDLDNVSVAVPEPSSVALASLLSLGLCWARRKK